jgi:hypothetical protein
MNRFAPFCLFFGLAGLLSATGAQGRAPAHGEAGGIPPKNVILFVADGLRAEMVRAETAPTLFALRRYGVWFKNSHALFPTFTTPNASALATGHFLGDTGDFGNVIYSGYPVATANGSPTPFLESDPVLGDIDEHFAGNYLDEQSVLAAARALGYATAAVGKLGPVAIQDVTARDGEMTIIVDDLTGHPGGIALAPRLLRALEEARLSPSTPGRGANGSAGDLNHEGTHVANIDQQKYFVDVTTRAILPLFKSSKKPFVLVFWSRDPDGTQHNQGDSLGELTPGINGPSSLAAIRNADDNLAALLGALEAQGLAPTTDVLVTSDHGFSTISKQSKTSVAARQPYDDVRAGQLPPGFLAIDLAAALGQPLFDPDAKGAPIQWTKGVHPSRANGLVGPDALHPDVVVAANGGSDLLYLTGPDPKSSAAKVVQALIAEDYVSGLFVDDRLGPIAGTLPLSAINLEGGSLTPRPSIVVNFTSGSSACPIATNCAFEVSDTLLQQGQGMHGSFSRADTYNFMAASGPDFRSGFIDPAPASNADLGQTIAALAGLQLQRKGELVGRVLAEARPGGIVPHWKSETVKSAPAENGLSTVLNLQTVGAVRYFDAAGFQGRTQGLSP